MKTEIENIEKMSPAKLFKPKAIGALLKAIEAKATAEIPDADTPTGRDAIKSLAYKVARSKTTIDELGKNFVAEQKAAISAVDDVRKTSRDFLDDLKARVRKPLTDWEEAEEKRIQRIQAKIDDIRDLGAACNVIGDWLKSEQLQFNLESLRETKITKAYGEYQDEAENIKNAMIVQLMEAIPAQKEREHQERENERRRLQEEEQIRIDNEARIAREAVAAAENKAQQELARVQQEAEDKRIIDEDERLQREARENDVKHRRAVNREAAEGISAVLASVDNIARCDELAKKIVQHIAKGNIPYVTINY